MASNLERRLRHVEARLGAVNTVADGRAVRERLDSENEFTAAHPSHPLVAEVAGLALAFLRAIYIEKQAAKGKGDSGGPFLGYPPDWRSSEEITERFMAKRRELDEVIDAWHTTL